MITLVVLLFVARCTLGEYPYQYYNQDGHGGYDYGYDAHLSSKHESGDHDGNVHGSFSYLDGDGHFQSAHYTADPHSGFNVHASNLPVAPQHDPHLIYAGGYGHESHDYRYHGPPAPLKKDGTVDYTPEVKKARAEHFAALHAHKHGYPQYVTPLYSHVSSHDYDDSHHYEPHVYAGGYSHDSHDYKYHGPPAPLKHDGTVDDLPEVKAARAHHLAEYAKVLYRHRRSLLGFGAPLKHDGTVDETPEVKHATAEHLAAIAHAKSFSFDHSSHFDEPTHFNDEHDFSHHDGHHYHGPPAPLNHDGTVAETPEVKHLKSIHFAAHDEANSRIHSSSHYTPHFDHDDHYDDHSHFDFPSHSHDDHTHKYHGPPAPLNHDGTVAETPDVKHAKAIHFQLYNQALHRYKRSPIFEPAPLLPDGRVDDTAEIKQAKAIFHEAYAAEAAHADHSWVEPKHYEEQTFNNHLQGFSKPIFEEHSIIPSHQFTPIQHSFDAPSFESHSDYSAPIFDHGSHFKQPAVPAPLNHDGTVADTPEIRAAKAIHFAAHSDALTRIASVKQYQKPSYIF